MPSTSTLALAVLVRRRRAEFRLVVTAVNGPRYQTGLAHNSIQCGDEHGALEVVVEREHGDITDGSLKTTGHVRKGMALHSLVNGLHHRFLALEKRVIIAARLPYRFLRGKDAGRDHAARGSEAAHITATSARTRPSPGIHGVSGVALGF